jgi:hypothetical protein
MADLLKVIGLINTRRLAKRLAKISGLMDTNVLLLIISDFWENGGCSALLLNQP